MSVIQSQTGRGANSRQLILVCDGYPAPTEPHQAFLFQFLEMPGDNFASRSEFHGKFLMSNLLLPFTVEFHQRPGKARVDRLEDEIFNSHDDVLQAFGKSLEDMSPEVRVFAQGRLERSLRNSERLNLGLSNGFSRILVAA